MESNTIMKQANRRLLVALILLLLVSVVASAQERATPYIYALSNPIVTPPDQTSGTVTLVWDGGKDHPYAEVWIRVDQNDETFIVEQGKGTRNEKVELGRSYEFKLSDANVLLASVRVTVTHEMPDTQSTPVSTSAVPTPSPDYSVSDNTSGGNAPRVTPSNFAGCWTFSGKGSFAGAGLRCFKQEGDRVTFDEPIFEGTVVGDTLRFKVKAGIKSTVYAFRSGRFQMDMSGKKFVGSVNATLDPDDNDYPVTATFDKAFSVNDKSGVTNKNAPKVAPSDFTGCWTFAGKGSFARSGLGCFKQDGDRVTFEDPVFEGVVVGNTLRFTLKAGTTNTAYAFHSGRFVMDKDGKKFIGSINRSLNPDDNDYPATATLDKSFKRPGKD